jgi:DNA-binding transcriptional LysR family regulator
MIGTALFERSKAGASLTPAGHQFHKHALALVRIWEHARLEVGLAEEHKDHFAVGAQISLWDGFLLHWIAWMRDRHPSIAITAMMGHSNLLMERLSEGTLDIAVMYRPVNKPGLIIEHILNEELVMVSSDPNCQNKPDHKYIFVNWGPEFHADHALAYPTMTHPGLSLDLGSLGINYLLENKASGYFPTRVVQHYIDKEELFIVKRTPRFVYPAYVVYPEQRNETAFEPFLEKLRNFNTE